MIARVKDTPRPEPQSARPHPVSATENEGEVLLMVRFRAGDEAAFEEIYRAEVGKVYGLMLRLTADPALAEEITQETFVRSWSHRGKIESLAHCRAWLRRVAVNQWVSRGRKRQRWGEPVLVEPDGSTLSAGATTPGLKLDLEAAIGALPERSRAIVVLFDICGLTHAEIAEMLGIGIPTSKLQLHRARKKLREVLKS